MLKFIIPLVAAPLVCLTALAETDLPRAGERDTKAAIRDLCAKGIEGSYVGTLDGKAYRFNLFCVEGERIVTSFGEQTKFTGVMLSLGEAAVDGEDLILSTFKIEHDERRDISARNTLAYLRLSLAELAHGKLRGYFHVQNLGHFQAVNAKKAHEFPSFDCDAGKHLAGSALVGAYTVHGTSFGEVTLLADVLAGTPVFTLLIPDLEGRNAMDGPEWNGSGCFESYTSQGDWEPESRQVLFLRGQLLGNGKMKVYWVTYRGLEGPYLATKKARSASHP